MRDAHERHTHPNAKRAGIALTWRNLAGVRPQTAQSVTRDKRVAEIRAAQPPMSKFEVALVYGVKLKTAESYLAMARGDL